MKHLARAMVFAAASLASLVGLVATPGESASAQSSSAITLDVDSPISGINFANGQRVFVGGWAGMPGGATSGITSVDLYLDGGPATGTSLGSARLGVARPDVASAMRHPEWANSGYNFDWVPRNASAGQHTLYVVARTATGESATQTVDVSSCGCGINYQTSPSSPAVMRIGTLGYEIDTGGPGVLIQRDMGPFWWW